MRIAIKIVGLMLLLSQAAHAGTTVIPFTLRKTDVGAPLILVQVEVNGKAATLCLDSGAQLVGVAPSYLKGLPSLGDTYVAGVGGRMKATAAFVNITIGTDTFREVAIGDKGVAGDGFLGESILSHYSKITIDYAAKTITLERP